MVKDLGGQNGTYVNRWRREANKPYVLNADDLLGIGTPEAESTLNQERQQGGGVKKKETFVYRVKAPSAFLTGAAAHLAAEGDEFLDHDAPTPPPVDIQSDQDQGGRDGGEPFNRWPERGGLAEGAGPGLQCCIFLLVVLKLETQ